MDDFLAEGKPWRKVAEILAKIGIRLPLPVKLRRAQGPWSEEELMGEIVKVSNIDGNMRDHIDSLFGSSSLPKPASDTLSHARYSALVFDATRITNTAELQALYNFYHENLIVLNKNGRIIIIGTNHTPTPESSAVQQALLGFTKALSKEVGKNGIAANLVRVDGTREALAPMLWFLLSNHSSFITGQVFELSDKAQLPANIVYTKPLQGKTALVTGAARGIGNSIARRLAEEGATVIVLDRKEEQGHAEATAKEIGGKTLLLDITTTDAPATIREFVKKNFNGLDIIIHNAGITRDRTLANMDQNTWDQVIAVNLTAAIRINDLLLKDTYNNNGRIVCMASISGIGGIFGQTNYSATKAGLIGYVKVLAEQVAAKGITANAIAPGHIETAMTAKIPFMTREASRRLNSFSQGGLPIDVAELAVFLSTPNSAGISGQTIRVCGGNVMGA